MLPHHFLPEDIIIPTLVEVYQMMLHTKYQDSGHFGFRSEDFKSFSYWLSWKSELCMHLKFMNKNHFCEVW